MWCLFLSGLSWAKKTGIFILGTLTIMTVTKIGENATFHHEKVFFNVGNFLFEHS